MWPKSNSNAVKTGPEIGKSFCAIDYFKWRFKKKPKLIFFIHGRTACIFNKKGYFSIRFLYFSIKETYILIKNRNFYLVIHFVFFGQYHGEIDFWTQYRDWNQIMDRVNHFMPAHPHRPVFWTCIVIHSLWNFHVWYYWRLPEQIPSTLICVSRKELETWINPVLCCFWAESVVINRTVFSNSSLLTKGSSRR